MTQSSNTRKQLLRTTLPFLYKELMEELSTHHIHSYDVEAFAEINNKEVKIQVCFGEDYTHELTKTFPKQKLNQENDNFTNFCKEIGETCKETLIADYFKMVKP